MVPTITCVKIKTCIELDESIKCNVIFVNHSKVFIKSKGTIIIRLKKDSHQSIGNVYYILTIKKTIY